MKKTRREFIKETTVAGMTIGICSLHPGSSYGTEATEEACSTEQRCPFFSDQPLYCGGKDKNGKYRCDA